MFAFYFPLPVIQIQKAELFFETPTKHDHSVSDWTFSTTRSYLSQRPFNFQTGVIVREFHLMSISNLLPRDVLSLVWAQCSQIRHKKTVAIFHVATFRIFDESLCTPPSPSLRRANLQAPDVMRSGPSPQRSCGMGRAEDSLDGNTLSVQGVLRAH